MAENTKADAAQAEQIVSGAPEATANIKNTEFITDSTGDVQYLLDQCESLVRDRDSWKQRATEAEKLISQLKMAKQELIRAVTNQLNKS
ncbi:MAG: hypothetical protein V3R87_11020 [Dehalococcoidia bacterium]